MGGMITAFGPTSEARGILAENRQLAAPEISMTGDNFEA
jgi:hypothetical protein